MVNLTLLSVPQYLIKVNLPYSLVLNHILAYVTYDCMWIRLQLTVMVQLLMNVCGLGYNRDCVHFVGDVQ